MKIIISGGGTGGHVYPAIAIADAFRQIDPATEILFVGAEGKMEMNAVPKAGYKIIGLPISGLQRSLSMRNVSLVFKLASSLFKAWNIIGNFKPDAVIGVGGYASGPVLKVAAWRKIPYFIQEQNSYAGITNKLLGNRASAIFVAFKGMERFFPKDKIILAGNPVRNDFLHLPSRDDARRILGIHPDKRTIGIFGGSLGARTLNEAVSAHANEIEQRQDLQLLWQVGRTYKEEFVRQHVSQLPNVFLFDFIDRMDCAYAASDVCVARAGAITLSELAVTGTPAILVPSPNVAEDHQTRNAETMVGEDAAGMVSDRVAKEELWQSCMSLLRDTSQQEKYKKGLSAVARPNAALTIAREVIKMIHQN
ncbi:MAG: undecaprenyldiphospho-muramoylpentapeptide beta-N-acetylglucosaminyltransferase [Saprospiraceae bacterium]